ncbi:MAG: TetR/AcrR family transcriptional regulator [Myxococcota bacterium]
MATTKAQRETNHRTRVGRQRRARTETRILEAALDVFGRMGPNAPKIDDFVATAGISRGTFYNHFDSVDALLEATSEWTTRELIHTIEHALEGIEGPAIRFGIGLRLFFAKAQADRTWSRFVGRVWSMGGLEFPQRDLEEGIRTGVVSTPSPVVTGDLLQGGVRQALVRIGSERVPASYGDEMAELCLRVLGVDRRRIATVMKHELPATDRATE